MKKYVTWNLQIVLHDCKDVVCASDPFSGKWDDNNEWDV